MRISTIILAAVALALLASGVSDAASGGGDVIVFKNGKQIFGSIVDETPKGVRIKINRGRIEKLCKASEIQLVRYSDRPQTYREARRLQRRGQYTKAAKMFRAARKSEARPWLQVYAPFYEGESLALAGDYAGAVKAYRKCVDVDPASRLAADAQLGIALCSYTRRDYSEAAGELDELLGKCKDAGRKAVLMLLKADVLLAQGRNSAARELFGELVAKAGGHPTIVASAKLGVAIADVRAGKPGSEKRMDEALDGPAANALKFIACKDMADKASKAKDYDAALMKYVAADMYLSRQGNVDSFAAAPLETNAMPGSRGELLIKAAVCAELLKNNDEAIALYRAVRSYAVDKNLRKRATAKLDKLGGLQ